MIGAISDGGSALFRSLFRTYRAAFPTVVVHPVGTGEGTRNLIIVASDQRAPSKQTLVERWQRRRARFPTAPDLMQVIRDRYDGDVSAAGVPVLTDDYAPADALLVE